VSDPVTLRADARRNLDRVLDAAMEVFGERGMDAAIDEVAARAGVGRATVYRRFPTRKDLVAAVGGRLIDTLMAEVDAAADLARPIDRLVRVMERAAELQIGHRAFIQAVERGMGGAPLAVLERKAALSDALGRLLRDAQTAGEVRPDLEPADVPHLICAAAGSAPEGMSRDPGLWRRYLDVIVDGMRVSAGAPAAPAPARGATPRRRRPAQG
jgi:AcrR family transcriptional regulator